jgi:sensor histidine kinase YesM
VRAPALLLGALASLLVVPLIAQVLHFAQIWLHLCVGDCEPALAPFSGPWFGQAIRAAGVNLPVYAGFVLAWHAASYYREARDREMRAVELEGQLHQSQLEALRSQLNPHFLFNALHSMAELVHGNPKLAEQLIVRLGELLRQVLQSSNRQEVPLSEELEFIRGYVEIEQMRLGDRLHVNWDIDPSLGQVSVPSLVLQPLVENAIQHGIAAAGGPGTLTLRAIRSGEFLELEVRDNGPGLEPEAAARSRGIGLANTRARLQRLYGERQSFEIQAGEGLAVRLRIPVSAA